jgi:hypothetical protein
MSKQLVNATKTWNEAWAQLRAANENLAKVYTALDKAIAEKNAEWKADLEGIAFPAEFTRLSDAIRKFRSATNKFVKVQHAVDLAEACKAR